MRSIHGSRRTTGQTCCFLVAVLVWNVVGCRESRNSVDGAAVTTTTYGETASPAAAADVQEHSVVPYERTDVGALEVRTVGSDPAEWFDVLQNGKRAIQGNPPLLNSSIELPPGTYVVDVNRTQRPVTIEGGRKSILWTGDLVVQGEPSHAYWYPVQGDRRMVTSNPPLFNRSVALFPGTYTVFAFVTVDRGNERLGEAEVRAGRTTELQK